MKCVPCGVGLFVGLLVFLCSQLATNTAAAQSAAQTYVGIPTTVNGYRVLLIEPTIRRSSRSRSMGSSHLRPPYNPTFDSPSSRIVCGYQGWTSNPSSVGRPTGTRGGWNRSYSVSTGIGVKPEYIKNPYCETPENSFWSKLDAVHQRGK